MNPVEEVISQEVPFGSKLKVPEKISLRMMKEPKGLHEFRKSLSGKCKCKERLDEEAGIG